MFSTAAQRADLVADQIRFQPHGSPAVSAPSKWVNRRLPSSSDLCGLTRGPFFMTKVICSSLASAKREILGVVARHLVVGTARVGAAVKPVGKLDVRNGHVQFDERGRETIGGL